MRIGAGTFINSPIFPKYLLKSNAYVKIEAYQVGLLISDIDLLNIKCTIIMPELIGKRDGLMGIFTILARPPSTSLLAGFSRFVFLIGV